MRNFNDINKVFGNKIRSIRKSQNLTQMELAEKANIDDKYYGRIERGESSPTLNTIFKLSKATKIKLEYLFGDMD